MKLTEMFLIEAQDYEGMFTKIIAICAKIALRSAYDMNHLEEQINRQIEVARTKLKKKDRIVWYLRYFRSVIAHQWMRHAPKEEKALLQPFLLDIVGNPPEDFDSVPFWLQHYLSLPIPAIHNFVFTNQSMLDVSTYFQRLEEEWKESTNQLSFADPLVHVLIDFGDGIKWVDTHRASCSKEAAAMGHCGNSPRQHTTDHLLSLRRFQMHDGKEVQTPLLTFIFDSENHSLTEMKGRGNAKPAEKYFPYIMALLKLPMIEDVVGGGYLPQNNFSMNDLTDAQRKEVFNANPSLMGWWDHYERTGELTDIIVKKLFREIGMHNLSKEVTYLVTPDTLSLRIDAHIWYSIMSANWMRSPWLTAATRTPADQNAIQKAEFHELWLSNEDEIKPVIENLEKQMAVKAKKKFADLIDRFDSALEGYHFVGTGGDHSFYECIVDLNAHELLTNIHQSEIKKLGRYHTNYASVIIDLSLELTDGGTFANWFLHEEEKCRQVLQKIFFKLDNAKKPRPHL
jgi:hypothetical protein